MDGQYRRQSVHSATSAECATISMPSLVICRSSSNASAPAASAALPIKIFYFAGALLD